MRPESFDEDLMTDWSVWVLDHGLPDLPDRVAIGESVPVARWVGPHFGAVLHVQWSWSDDDNDDDYLDSEVEVFARSTAGWQPSDGSGGTGWFEPPFRRPASIGPRDAYVGHTHVSGRDEWVCAAADGIAGEEARFVEVIDADGTTRHPVESPFGAFIACTDGAGQATVHVLDGTGRVLFECQFGGDML